MNVPSADPFEAAGDSSKKGLRMNEVKEQAEDEDSQNGAFNKKNMDH